MEKDNVISLEHYRNKKQKLENTSNNVQERLEELDYPVETTEGIKVFAEMLEHEGMTNEDIAEAIIDQYGDLLGRSFEESGSSLEDLSGYREEKQKRDLGAGAIENTIYVIYGGGEGQNVPVRSGRRNHLKVVDNSGN